MTTKKPQTLIVALQSHKGGAGKTTIGLSIAHEWLTRPAPDETGPVLVLDADLLGTELADLWYDPADRPPNERWSLGLLDLVTQSVGGNSSFDDWLREKLGPVPPTPGTKIPGLPALPLIDGVWCPIIPTLRSASPDEEREAEADGLALRLVTDDFGLSQVRRRLALFLGRLVQGWKPAPALIVIDCSPFHLALGQAVEQAFSEPPKGLPEKHAHALQEDCRFVRLEVIGPDLSELASLPRVIVPAGKNPKVHRRWVLNRDLHRPALDAPAAECPLLELIKQRGLAIDGLLDPRVLHVGFEIKLAHSSLTHMMERTSYNWDSQSLAATAKPNIQEAWKQQREGLALETRWRWLKGRFEEHEAAKPAELSWRSFLTTGTP
jgi:hypothetical protein